MKKFTHFLYGVMFLFLLANTGMFYFNLKLLTRGEHITFLRAKADCQIMDSRQADYVSLTSEFPAQLPKRK